MNTFMSCFTAIIIYQIAVWLFIGSFLAVWNVGIGRQAAFMLIPFLFGVFIASELCVLATWVIKAHLHWI